MTTSNRIAATVGDTDRTARDYLFVRGTGFPQRRLSEIKIQKAPVDSLLVVKIRTVTSMGPLRSVAFRNRSLFGVCTPSCSRLFYNDRVVPVFV